MQVRFWVGGRLEHHTTDRSHDAEQRLIQSISPSHGRALIYVWAVEQDDLSKRTIPTTAGNEDANSGQDVFVPWVLSHQTRPKERKTKGSQHPEQATKHTELAIAREEETHAHTQDEPQQTFNRYYHMFARRRTLGRQAKVRKWNLDETSAALGL